jgi:hypothetical protein
MLINTEGDGFKEFNLSKLGNDYSVTHFRYNRNDNTKRNNMLNA